jgi:hypothetical protein
MSESSLQEPFLLEVAASFVATKLRIMRRLKTGAEDVEAILEHEMRGLYHGLFVILDGGSALAEKGLVHVVDEDGASFDPYLHEICFRYWPGQSP